MAKQMISSFKEGDYASTFVQVEEKQLMNHKGKSGHYSIFAFSDKSGSIKGICWNRGEEFFRACAPGAIVYVEGRINIYNDQLQLNVERMSPERENEASPEDFLPVSSLDVDALFNEILKAIDETKNPFLKKLLESVFHDEEFVKKFKKCPAAKSIHHSYLGGLLEHTHNCMKLAQTLCTLYQGLNKDMLIAGVLIHDMGKTVELSFDRKVDYTDKGRFMGHIVIGFDIIQRKIDNIPDFPEHLANELLHLIISHHGENSTGSPKRPKTAEACALHFLENLDAQTKRFLQIIEENKNQTTPSRWTGYDRLLERYIYLGVDDDD